MPSVSNKTEGGRHLQIVVHIGVQLHWEIAS